MFPDKAFIQTFNKQPLTWKKVCFAISMFHACINERTNYDHCGWNQEYTFGEADYDLSLSHLNSIMKSQDFSMSTLQYLIAECTYGGRMEDEWDMRTLTTFLEHICGNMNIDADTDFDPDGVYHTKSLNDHETMMEYLNELPTDTAYDVCGVNIPNHWNKDENKGLAFLKKLRQTQGLDLKGDDEEDDPEAAIRSVYIKLY